MDYWTGMYFDLLMAKYLFPHCSLCLYTVTTGLGLGLGIGPDFIREWGRHRARTNKGMGYVSARLELIREWTTGLDYWNVLWTPHAQMFGKYM